MKRENPKACVVVTYFCCSHLCQKFYGFTLAVKCENWWMERFVLYCDFSEDFIGFYSSLLCHISLVYANIYEFNSGQLCSIIVHRMLGGFEQCHNKISWNMLQEQESIPPLFILTN